MEPQTRRHWWKECKRRWSTSFWFGCCIKTDAESAVRCESFDFYSLVTQRLVLLSRNLNKREMRLWFVKSTSSLGSKILTRYLYWAFGFDIRNSPNRFRNFFREKSGFICASSFSRIFFDHSFITVNWNVNFGIANLFVGLRESHHSRIILIYLCSIDSTSFVVGSTRIRIKLQSHQ